MGTASSRCAATTVVSASIALLAVCGATTASQAQARSYRQLGGTGPQPTPAPAPAIPKYRGGILPGSLGRSSLSGIGEGRANIDLLSNPARDRVFPPVPVTLPPNGNPGTPGPGYPYPRYHHHNHDSDHGHHYYPNSDYGYNDGFISVGSGLFNNYGYGYPYGGLNPPVYVPPLTGVGAYGYSPYGVYPGYGVYNTTGIVNLPAPAVVFDPSTGMYVYGYGNPATTALYPNTAPTAPVVTAPQPQSTDTTRRTPTAPEIASYQLNQGLPAQAVVTLTAYLRSTPDDARSVRLLGVSLLEAKRFDEGIATVREAYRSNPGLASQPLAGSTAGLDADYLRDLVVRCVGYANRVDSGSAWLTVSILMQAEGRNALARKMLEKAHKKGLEPEIEGALKVAL